MRGPERPRLAAIPVAVVSTMGPCQREVNRAR